MQLPAFNTWANKYLQKFWKKVVNPGVVQGRIRDTALWHEVLEAFEKCNCVDLLHNCIKNIRTFRPLITDQELYCFVEPLGLIYDETFKSDKLQKKIGKNSQFQYWANKYLKIFFNEVVLNVDKPEICNKLLWQEIIDASKNAGVVNKFDNFLAWSDIHEDELRITNHRLSDFVPPLSFLFRKNRKDILKNICSSADNCNGFHAPNDLFDVPEEVLNVALHPVTLPSMVGTDEFKERVISSLTHCLKRGYRWVANDRLATAFGIDARQFEVWAHNNLDLRPLTGSGITYWALPFTNKNNNESQDNMTQHNTNGHVKESPKELPKIGTNDFDQLVTNFLLNSESPWRSGAAIAKELGYEQGPLEEWLLNQSTIYSRSGKEAGRRLFSNASRHQVVKPSDVLPTETKDNTSNSSDSTKVKGKSKFISQV